MESGSRRFAKRARRVMAVVLPVTFLAGCASYERPAEVTAQMARAESSLQQAEQSGATQAALSDLQRARDKYTDAQRELEKKNREGDRNALRLAQQAELDAQYAAARARTLQQQESAAQVQEGVEAVRDEADRNTLPARPLP